LKEVAAIIKSAWNDFKGWYDERCESYIKSDIDNGMSPENVRDSHWVCWTEKDLVLHLSRFIYQKSPDLDVHVEFEMKPKNFSGNEKFSKLLEKAQNNFAGRTGREKVKPDMVVCWWDELPFAAAVESKMFRGQHLYGRTPEEDIKKDIETLRVLLEEDICKNAFWMVLDDHYWLKDDRMSKQLEKMIRELAKEGIGTLYHKSTIKQKFLNQ